MLAAIERQRGSQQWVKDNGQFIPHAATWLNQERWQDVVAVEVKQSSIQSGVMSRHNGGNF